MPNVTFQHEIIGELVGHIWMPNALCTKDVRYDLTAAERLFSEPGTLRDHVLQVTNDGDFRSADLAAATSTLKTTVTTVKGGLRRTRTRYFRLERFSSISDMVNTEYEPD